jgi:DNA-3-methyladenine glycosylase
VTTKGSGSISAIIDFDASAPVVARKLIGALLLLNDVGGIVVETEAYDEREPASHAFSGPTPRNSVLFGPSGRAYVYLSHGIHWCLNIVCRESGHGAGVLIRALEPTHGIPVMMKRRRSTDLRLLCSGPGRLGQALAVDATLNGQRIDVPPFAIVASTVALRTVRGPRIGISKAIDRAWRFGLKGSAFVSRRFSCGWHLLCCRPDRWEWPDGAR